MNDSSELLGRRYRIEKKYSGDGYILCKATDIVSNDRKVGIKTPSDAVMSNESALAKFVNEVELQRKFDHPGLVKVLHFYKQGEIDSRCHLVTEWTDTTLDEVLEAGDVRRDVAISIVQMIIRGLTHLHDNGIVHRGIEPNHIFLSSNYSNVKIGNFGNAVKIGYDQTFPGRPRYEAPESYDPDWSIDQRADVYSLGFVCYELLIGREKFQAQFPEIYGEKDVTVQADRWLHWHLDPERRLEKLSSLNPDVDERLSQIVAKMIEKDPRKRYMDLQEVVGAFSSANQMLGWREEIKPIDLTGKKKDTGDRSNGSRMLSKVVYVSLAMIFVGAILFFGYDYIKGDLTDDDIVAASLIMEELREKAVEAGADKLVLESYAEATTMVERAKKAHEAGNLADAMQFINSAKEGFRAAESEAISIVSQLESLFKQADELRGRVGKLRVDSNSELVVKAVGQLDEARAARKETDIQVATERVSSAIAGLKQAIKTLPRNFEKGSTVKERASALDLCRQYDDSCNRAWYETEVVADALLLPFSIDQHEVTNREFSEFVNAENYQTTAERLGYGFVWDGADAKKTSGVSWLTAAGTSSADIKKPDYPVRYMSFYDATAYCSWRGKRLPTEAEWEYASRGAVRNQFPWGNSWDEDQLLWDHNVLLKENKPVGSFQQATSGAQGYDYAGSVWEWVWDKPGKKAVLKGGSFREVNPADFRLANQRHSPEDVANSDDGFRCVKDVDEWPEIMSAIN